MNKKFLLSILTVLFSLSLMACQGDEASDGKHRVKKPFMWQRLNQLIAMKCGQS